jgi:hypothetical protein
MPTARPGEAARQQQLHASGHRDELCAEWDARRQVLDEGARAREVGESRNGEEHCEAEADEGV